MFDNLEIRSSVLQPSIYVDVASCVIGEHTNIKGKFPVELWQVLRRVRIFVAKHSPLERVFLGEQYAAGPFFLRRKVTAFVSAMLNV